MTGRLFHVAKKVHWLGSRPEFVAAMATLALVTLLMLLLRAGDERVPQTRIENDVPVLIDGVPHICDFSITSDSDSRDTASATCEESP